MPYVKVTCKSLIKKGFQGTPQTVGEHILKKRLEAGLTQKDVAALFGVDCFTILNWEKGHIQTIPATRMSAVIQFLGYNPEPKPDTVGGQLRWKRRLLGWTTKDAAHHNSVDQSTWEAWEKAVGWPRYPRCKKQVTDFLTDADEFPSDRLM